MNVVAYLNAIIQKEERTEPSPDHCRFGLLQIETTELAVAALRSLVEHPKNPEAFAHAERYLLIYDAHARVAAAQTGGAPVAAATIVEDQDVSDLV